MPGNARSTPVEMIFPIKGINRGYAMAHQPIGTCPDALNVRAFDNRDRMGGGKRSGLGKALTERAGSAGTRRITHMDTFSQAAGAIGGGIGSIVNVDDDFSSYSVGGPTDVGDNWMYDSENIAEVNISADGLTIDADAISGNAAVQVCFYARFPTTNDVTATLRCRPTASSANTNQGAADDCTNFGPFIRGNVACRDFITAILLRNAADTSVIISIERWVTNTAGTAGVRTILKQSSPITISGGATVVEDATLRLYEESGSLTAVLNWASESITDASTTIATSINEGNSRAGVALVINPSFTVATFRTFARVQLTMFEPSSPTVAYSLNRLLAGSNRYYLPAGWTTFTSNRVTPTTITTTVGQFDSGTSPGLNVIDTSASTFDTFSSSGVGALARMGGILRTDNSDGPFHTEIQFSASLTDSNSFEYLFRISDDFRSFMRLSFSLTNPTSASKLVYQSGADALTKVVDGTVTTIDSNIQSMSRVMIRKGATWVRITDDGTGVSVYVDGMFVFKVSTLELADQWGRSAVGFNSSTSGDPRGIETIRLIRMGDFIDVTDSTPLIAIYTSGKVDVANLVSDTLSPTSGIGLLGQLPSSFSFNKKWYAVDGDDAKITDPADLTTVDWSNEVTVNGEGSFPTGCQLACLYRGRAVLARTESQPWIWYMSRTFDPLDWDFGADPQATTAWAGSNALAGQPGDVITCLAPVSDDYLIFGCASSIWMMEGDPGYGGQVQCLSQKTGIAGPRAFCFDEQGNMFFYGQGGIYMLPRGSRDIQHISGRRVSSIIDRVLQDRNIIQLCYDAFKGYVHIFITPTDQTVGTHIVYDRRGDAFWFDEYPAQAGPWAVTSMTGPDYQDRRLLLGGNDGIIRRFFDGLYYDLDSDNSEPATTSEAEIDSFVRFAHFESDHGNTNSLLTELQFEGDQASGEITWEMLRGASPEDVNRQTVNQGFASGTIFGNGVGFQRPVRIRSRAACHQLFLRHTSNDSDWAFERCRAYFAPVGRRRS